MAKLALEEKEFASIMSIVRGYLRENGSIKNSQLRELTRLNYDQVTWFFNTAVSRGLLIRRGRTGGTHYMRPARSRVHPSD